MAKRHVNCLLELVWKPKLFAKYFVKLDIIYLTLSLEIETESKFVEDSNFGHKLLTFQLSNFKELETIITNKYAYGDQPTCIPAYHGYRQNVGLYMYVT